MCVCVLFADLSMYFFFFYYILQQSKVTDVNTELDSKCKIERKNEILYLLFFLGNITINYYFSLFSIVVMVYEYIYIIFWHYQVEDMSNRIDKLEQTINNILQQKERQQHQMESPKENEDTTTTATAEQDS